MLQRRILAVRGEPCEILNMTIAEWIVLAVLVLVGFAIWWHFSLRRRIDKRMHEAPPEEREALMKVQRDIDRGKAARQGFFF